MSTAFRIQTYPELRATMFAWLRFYQGDAVDLREGSVIRTILEAAAFMDAEQFVQMARLLDLFSLEKCVGDDVDRRALDFGAGLVARLRRRPANTSICKISVSDGRLLVRAVLTGDVLPAAVTFIVNDATAFPTSGALILDRGTERAEQIVYTRAGNSFTVVAPVTGLVYAHALGAEALRVATRTVLAAPCVIGDTVVTVLLGTGAAWPVTGTLILERATVREEYRTYTRVGDTFTVAATTFAHALDTDVVLSTSGSSRSISADTVCYVPASSSSKQVNFSVVTPGVLLDGDFTSDLIDVISVDVGAATRVGSATITQWTAAPFAGATVLNPIAATRGADREQDGPFRKRLRNELQSLSKGTPLALETLTSGLEDPLTKSSVAFVEIVEPVSPGTSLLYISDGTSTFTLDQRAFIGRDILIRDAEVGDRRGRLGQYGPYAVSASLPVTPRIFKSLQRGEATSVGIGVLTDLAQALTVNAHVGQFLKTDDDQFYEISSNTATAFTLFGGATPSLGAYSVFDLAVAPLVPDVDFVFNESTGDLELTTGLLAHDALIAASDGASVSEGAYLYSSGLAAYVQRAVNGDRTDFDTFPGIRAAGTKVVLRAPAVIASTFIIKIIPKRGFSDAQVGDGVRETVQAYVNSLGIGENVYVSEVIRLIKGLADIEDVTMIAPTTNLTVPSGQILRITSDDVVLV
jgi:uncharacterized phage protein gp47/JayE